MHDLALRPGRGGHPHGRNGDGRGQNHREPPPLRTSHAALPSVLLDDANCDESCPPALRQLPRREPPQRVLEVVTEGTVVREDLEVVTACPPRPLDRVEDRGEVDDAVAREHAVAPAPGRPAPVVHLDGDEAVAVARDLVLERRRVPQVPGVEDEPDVRAGLVDERGGVPERGHERPVLLLVARHRLEPDGNAEPRRLVGERAQPLGERRTGLVFAEVSRRPGRADERRRLKGRQAPHPRHDRLDPLPGVARPRELRQRQDRGNRRDGRARLEPALPERVQLLCFAALDELALEDRDAVGSGGGIGGEVVLEARRQRRELADREAPTQPPPLRGRPT